MNDNPQGLRQYVARVARFLRDEPDREKVRVAAGRLASTVDDDGRFRLMDWVKAIPIDIFAQPQNPRGARWLAGREEPIVPRDEKTNFAVEKLLEAAEGAIKAIEDYQVRAAANASLSLDDRRDLVLRTIASIDEQNGAEAVWFEDVRWYSGLSTQQTLDAVEHWHDNRLLRSKEEPGRFPDKTVWRFWLTAKGRTWIAKGPPASPVAAILGGIHVAGDLAMHSHGPGTVQQVGSGNVAHVQQVIMPNLSEAIAVIREHLDEYPEAEREEVQAHLEVLREAQQGQQTPSRAKAALKAIARITRGVGETFAPIIQAVVGGIVSGMS